MEQNESQSIDFVDYRNNVFFLSTQTNSHIISLNLDK
jgi:hypothetical protein